MLSSSSLRIVRSSRALLTSRECVYKAVTCSAQCMSSSFPQKDTWTHSNTNFTALEKERKPICPADAVRSPRNYCTAQVQVTCWNCKQPLDKTPAFFCMSCKVVQPPEEGTSYFKIMDWWVTIHWLTRVHFIYLVSLWAKHFMFLPCVAFFQWLHIHSGHTQAAEKILAAAAVSTSRQLRPESCGRQGDVRGIWIETRGVTLFMSQLRLSYLLVQVRHRKWGLTLCPYYATWLCIFVSLVWFIVIWPRQ